ncbi:DUF1697 domain-containing protein [Dyadobacter aurulentus]|uniref:DUF1697 domain-containing protein n=1 Tax=Dyadobacter sp. UC 10 TaxID=2605428 RepID=UPI0011F2BBC6|nr:DUF1697 domain-containing protein [Dyadobacter sp. UC 10]KAA0992388.1 DUF1697 domain-containing protein [Dyadobacter sp. UC 10]
MLRSTYVAILRGINVSGHNLIKMPALVSLLEKEGFEDCKTYIQSGNVLFNTEKADEQKVSARIKTAIENAFGYDVPVIVLSLAALRSVLEQNPFLELQHEDITKLHATFLSEIPDKEAFGKIDGDKYKPDEFILVGNTIYLFCPDGYGRTKLNNNFFENKLKVTATTRNWKTVVELVRLAEALSTQQ